MEKLRADRKDADWHPEMPEVGAYHLVNYLWDAGPVSTSGMGPAPLAHGEIDSWQRNAGIELSAWEARTLRRLSAEYISEQNRAESPACPSPLAPVLTEQDRERLSNAVGNAFRMLINTRPKR